MVVVSVIMVTKNGADFIKKSIQSILDQTYEDFELIIVYQPSEDNTLECIKSFNDKRINLLYSNFSFPSVSNVGIDAARGEYIAVNDDDDISHPMRLELEVEALDENPSVNVGCSTTMTIDGDGNKLHEEPLGIYDGSIPPFEYIWEREYFIPHSSSMYRKNEVRYDGKMRKAGDYKFFMEQLYRNNKVIQFEKPLVYIRRNITSHSSEFSVDDQIRYRKMAHNDLYRKYHMSWFLYMKGLAGDYMWGSLQIYRENKFKSIKYLILTFVHNPFNKEMWKRIVGKVVK